MRDVTPERLPTQQFISSQLEIFEIRSETNTNGNLPLKSRSLFCLKQQNFYRFDISYAGEV